MNPTPSIARSQAPRWPHHFAAIDIGSNSFRLEIGQVLPGGYRRVAYLKETVRLGAGLDRHAASRSPGQRSRDRQVAPRYPRPSL